MEFFSIYEYVMCFFLCIYYFCSYFNLNLRRSKNLKTQVLGCPKTIDGDLKSKEVPTSFGFDTACKVNGDTHFSLHCARLTFYQSSPYLKHF